MSRFIVMDIVFYAGSLNYDQGSGNYQELKKITKWDGKQYTFVSRYALRYSLLETGRKLGLWEVAEGEKLSPEENQKVIQPSENLLLSGDILKYPEFDLFGYLLTSTQPQNFREAPVKISHAVSLTPFNYDALFNANIGLANRLRKIHGEMSPNPFTSEEHYTFYQYSLVIDVDRLGTIEVYLSKNYKKGNKTAQISKFEVDIEDKFIKFLIQYGDLKKLSFKAPHENDKNEIVLENVTIPFSVEKTSLPKDKRISSLFTFDEDLEVVVLKYKFTNITDRIEKLVEAVLNLHRSIKGRDEDLSPKLLILGLYKDVPYKTYRDKIILKDEYTEEEYDEIITEEKEGKVVRRVIHKVSRNKKPVFEIAGGESEFIGMDKVISKVEEFLKEDSRKESDKEFSKVYYAHVPEIEVKFQKKRGGE